MGRTGKTVARSASINNFYDRKTDQGLPVVIPHITSTLGKIEQTVFAHSSSEGKGVDHYSHCNSSSIL